MIKGLILARTFSVLINTSASYLSCVRVNENISLTLVIFRKRPRKYFSDYLLVSLLLNGFLQTASVAI